MQLALNQIAAPNLPWRAFLGLAAGVGAVGVELRGDLGRPLFDGDDPAEVGRAARQAGLRLLTVAELRDFNRFTDATRRAAEALIAAARACGAEAVTLIPRNDGGGRGNGERIANLRVALRELAPMLAEAGLTGLIEPLGFETSSLRDQAEAVDAIEGLGVGGTFALIHDTFHHRLAAGSGLHPAHTGLVHVSAVVDPAPAIGQMEDAHRVLPRPGDRLESGAQVAALAARGWDGPVSLEPFAPEVHALADPRPAIVESFEHVRQALAAPAPA